MKATLARSVGLGAILVTIAHVGRSTPLIALTAQDPIPKGQILQINGEVRLERRDGRVIHPTVGTRVYPGDRFLTVPGGQVFIQCRDLSIESVRENSNDLNVCLSAIVHSTSEDCNDGLIGCPIRENPCTPTLIDCPDRGETMTMRGSPSLPYIISPRRTYLLNDRPRLRWNAVAGATNYTVSLMESWENENNSSKLWRVTVAETQMSYPADATPLKPGTEYLLMVSTDTGAFSLDEMLVPGGVSFRLLDDDLARQVLAEKAKIEQQKLNESANALAVASLYINNGLIAEAIENLEELVASGMQTAPIYGILGELYEDYLALPEQAGEYYCRAIDLADENHIEVTEEAQARLNSLNLTCPIPNAE